MPPLLEAAQGDTAPSEVAVVLLSLLVLGGSVVAILTSYGTILATMLWMQAGGGATGRCSSPVGLTSLWWCYILAVLGLSTCGPTLGVGQGGVAVNVANVVVTSFLYPLVYSLCNYEVHAALQKLVRRRGPEG